MLWGGSFVRPCIVRLLDNYCSCPHNFARRSRRFALTSTLRKSCSPWIYFYLLPIGCLIHVHLTYSESDQSKPLHKPIPPSTNSLTYTSSEHPTSIARTRRKHPLRHHGSTVKGHSARCQCEVDRASSKASRKLEKVPPRCYEKPRRVRGPR
jgi:hypothetical protein